MRIFFIGSQDPGHEVFKRFLTASRQNKSNIELVGAISLDPAPHEMWTDDIKATALEENIPTKTIRDHLTLDKGSTATINAEEYVDFIKEKKPDLIFVFGWRQIIGKKIRNIAQDGTIGIHYSLLPKYRGHAPIPWAIINDEEYTGFSLFHLSQGVDCGDILLQKKVRILEEDSIATLREKVNREAIKSVEDLISYIQDSDKLPAAHQQEEREATITAYRLPQHSKIDWSKSDREIYNLIRASSKPYSGAYTHLEGQKVVVWSAELIPSAPQYIGLPGQILKIIKKDGIIVKTGENAVLIKQIQISEEADIASNLLTDTRKSLGE